MTRILVIDDDEDLRAALADILRDAGFEVLEAADGAHGLELQRGHPVDVVVTDLFMPRQEGMETVHKLRAEFPRLKIVAMSGGTAKGGRYDFLPIAKEMGADACLRKPFKAVELISTVRTLMR